MSTKLPTRQFGTTDMSITRVGFGAWATGGGGWAYGWGPQDDNQSIDAIIHAVERGINWIDTAPVYGLGHSEEVVGRALRKLAPADRPFVFTKCGLVGDKSDPFKDAVKSLRPDSIRKECEASLRRLGVERIDLYQFHRPDDIVPVESRGERWWSSSRKEKFARSGCRTSTFRSSGSVKRSGTSILSSRHSL